MHGCDIVFHLAANADVRFGTQHPRKDLEQNTIATFNVLEAARTNSIKRIVFSSTGSVYGETPVIPQPRMLCFPFKHLFTGPIKLQMERCLRPTKKVSNMEAYIFRFVSILGEHYTHA